MAQRTLEPSALDGVTLPHVTRPGPLDQRPDALDRDDPAASIIRSKVQSPVVRRSTLARGRLLDWLDRHADDRVRIIAAEAGFGKTTLLADWARRSERRIVWLRLDKSDAEWITFLNYVIAAFQEATPGFGRATLGLLAHVATLGTTLDQALGTLLSELGSLESEAIVLIVDDLHLTQDDESIQAILERLLERAPAAMTFVLSGRTRPELRLGRLAAQGEVAELGTDDLRFTLEETQELFARAYEMPLDDDLLPLVEERTEGWVASLQLLYSSIRSRRPAEVRAFIRSLSGSQEPLYEFLAEEVLGRQTATMQRVLLHAALIDRMIPALVVAALSAVPGSPSPDEIIDCLEQADDLGLMSRSAEASSSRRFHPLLREFLVSHLIASTKPEMLREMHLRVAQAAETIHWPTAAHHYIEARQSREAMRVLSESSVRALGTGEWGPAMELVERMPEIEPSVAVQVIRARSLVAAGDPQAAIDLLTPIEHPSLSPDDLALVRLALATAAMDTERFGDVDQRLVSMLRDATTPALLRLIAECWHLILASESAAKIGESLRKLEAECERQGLHLYAGLTAHNRALYLLVEGRIPEAIVEANCAMRALKLAHDDAGTAASTWLILASAFLQEGRIDECRDALTEALSTPRAQLDVFAEAAVLQMTMGDATAAVATLEEALLRSGARTGGFATDALHLAQAFIELGLGRVDEARRLLGHVGSGQFDPNNLAMYAYLKATLAFVQGDSALAVSTMRDAMQETARRGAIGWYPLMRLVSATVEGNHVSMAALLGSEVLAPDAALLTVVDLIGCQLHLVDPVPARLEHHVRTWPARWRPVLRRVILEHSRGGDSVVADAAARLLTEIGEQGDVEVVLAWERRRHRPSRERRLSRSLARRVSPTLRVRDLGRSSISVGEHDVPVSGMRRKPASLLMYLASRPRHTATKEQVMDDLWPDLEPVQAANSLHQTLYFLRQYIALDALVAKSSVEYVPVESEIVYLDPELVHVESAAFMRQASDVIARGSLGPDAVRLVHSYAGRFAPEFEYEEWSIPWREQLHSLYLQLAETTARDRDSAGFPADAAAVLRRALEVDSEAIDLMPSLVRALHALGSEAAARDTYLTYSARFRKEYEADALPYSDILDST